MSLSVGSPAPDFDLPASTGKSLSLKDFHGKKLVIYFYPKDDTSGCTLEAQDFQKLLNDFHSAGITVIGVSPDSMKKHDKFCDKNNLTFPLLSDEEKVMLNAYGVWVEKSMYGRKYMGVERTTVLIDPNGKIAQIWPKVKVTGHAEEVLAAAKAL
ncbi:thioredoxin-dependent thiol peroxidase [Microvirga sp. W0021]|uniref:thioredoxin-dependent peroxiredoxin n=1 Tax=Hohaiivirga grylli TaxID=3133970 RepID=A0ABV0BJ29_9HYPH